MIHSIFNNFLSKRVEPRRVAPGLFFFLLPLSVVSFQTTVYATSFYANAVIKDPVVEMNSNFPPPSNPFVCGDIEPCPRAHQGLFNELVTVIEQQGDCVKVACKNAVYGYHRETKEVLNTFWAYEKDIVFLQNLDSEALQAIPHPAYGQDPTIVLIYPWKNFSVGTRFKREIKQDTMFTYAIQIADFTANAVSIEFVPRKNALMETQRHPQSARKLFMKVIHQLIDRVEQSGQDQNGESNVIPYVWGGSSFVVPYTQSGFYRQDGSWNREGKNDPYCGYDCSEFIMRMAQIVGIEFPWKTSSMIERSKKALTQQDRLEEGDIIWMSGHVMIVGNIRRNEVIEARGYKSGYGCVHRFTVSECFDGISTYDELLKLYRSKKTVRLRNKQGVPVEKMHFFRFLKLLD